LPGVKTTLAGPDKLGYVSTRSQLHPPTDSVPMYGTPESPVFRKGIPERYARPRRASRGSFFGRAFRSSFRAGLLPLKSGLFNPFRFLSLRGHFSTIARDTITTVFHGKTIFSRKLS
jgi:hypothetical protein